MLPTALAIAGLDPSGGAGLAADLRSFGVAGVWGAAVCTTLTVQSTRGVRAVRAVPAALVLEQAREVLADARVRALKTGALGSAANARAVLALLAEHPDIPSVVDPVMIPSRRAARAGAARPALHGRAIGPLRALAAAATIVTPNLDEAAALLGRPVDDRTAPEAAAALVAAGRRRRSSRADTAAGSRRSTGWPSAEGASSASPGPAAGPRRCTAPGARWRPSSPAASPAGPTGAPSAPTISSRPRAGRGPGSTGPSRRRSWWAPVSA